MKDAILKLMREAERESVVITRLVDTVKAFRSANQRLHRRAQAAESELIAIRRQYAKPDNWGSRERQVEADERDRMMAAVGQEAERERKQGSDK